MSFTPTTNLLSLRRGNTLVLVTAILVMLVILATAFLVRSQSARAQAGAQNRAAGRVDRVEDVAEAVVQDIADSLFVRPVDQSSFLNQTTATAAEGITGVPINIARSDYPRLPPDALAIRYGVDYFDSLDNSTLALAAGGDGILDGYNYAPFSVIPFTNWPDTYGLVNGEGNPIGNPGFGDTRWLRSTEPVRALTVSQFPRPTVVVPPAPPNAQTAPAAPTADWSNLALAPGTALPILSPEGLGFSHWAHLSWLPTAENGFRVCYDISDVEAYTLASYPGVTPALALAGTRALGTPYEQWPANIPPRIPTISGKDSRGYLQLARSLAGGIVGGDWVFRRNQWFSNYANIVVNTPIEALPNFIQLSAFGDPSDEFKSEPTGSPLAGAPTSRALISRTLADADGDGFTDSFWYVSPTSSDRETRQVVAVCITDNSALLNVNIATRFERSNTNGSTPSDLALVTRRESFNESNPALAALAFRDTLVGFFNSRENDPEYRMSRRNPYTAPSAADLPYLTYVRTHNGGVPTSGIDVGFDAPRWEGVRTTSAVANNTNDATQNSFMGALGIMLQGTPTVGSIPAPLFNPSLMYGLPAPGGAGYGGWFVLTRPADRVTYFKAQANGGELVDPVTTARLLTLSPFGMDDEIELRGANGLNVGSTVSKLEAVLGDPGPVAINSGVTPIGAPHTIINARNFLRDSRSREETVRFLEPQLPGDAYGDPRRMDWRALGAWSQGNTAMAPFSGAELLMDHRRKLTTVSGARTEMLPPRLWSIIDPTAPNDLTRVRPAYIHRGVDFDHDGNPDDINGDGTVNGLDDVPPYDPRIVYYNTTPRGDANGDGFVTLVDAELARQEFLRRNRKVDLRRATDVPSITGVAANAADIAVAERTFRMDIQRLLRRALIDEDTRGSYFLDGTPAGASAQDLNKALVATKLMCASMAANIGSYRDGERRITNTLYLDSPTHPDDAAILPPDAIEDPQYSNARFIGVEKQPFLQEVYLAFVYPKTKLTQAEIDIVTGPPGSPNSGCPDSATCQVDPGDPGALPPCTENGAGEHFVTYEASDPSTWPAVVFVAQIANPYNAPVNLADFELRINPASGAPQRFFFGLPGPAGSRSGNSYGPDVELGPCTPEEPRTAIVFCIPETFPNGDPFPRDSWLDFLDLRKPDAAPNTNLADDTKPGQFFEPDVASIFMPAWGGPGGGANINYWTNNKRSGTLFFDATRTAAYPVGLDTSGDMARWQPQQSGGGPPPEGYVELRRALYRQTGGVPTWTVVDRIDNELNPGDQNFRDSVTRLYTADHLPPEKDIDCRQGKLAISGIRIRQNDYFTTWARGARQWLFDTQNNITGNPVGRGIITLDERTPRYAFARMTGADAAKTVQQDTYVGGAQSSRKGDVWAQNELPDGLTTGQPWITMDYYNVWGESKRGKPTFFSTRVFEQAAGQNRLYPTVGTPANPGDLGTPTDAWRLPNATPPATMHVSYGEKGVTMAKFVDGNDPKNFKAPYRFFQKDADFEQVAEILDVPMWGPLVEAAPGGGAGRTYATLPEIMEQEPDATSTLRFPKAPASANLAYWNRLQLDPARYDVTPGPGGRPNLLSGVPVVPSPVGFIAPQQAGIALLDAFTVDDRGAAVFDADNDGVINFIERANAENRRYRLAQGFQGKATPGVLNINTAPLEVMRAMPQMTRLVYEDDDHLTGIPTVADPTSYPAVPPPNFVPDPEPGLQQAKPRDFPQTPTTQFNAIGFDYGVPAPRVRLAESIDLWRTKGNELPFGGVIDPSMPSYSNRGVDLPDANNNLEHAPGMRQERGIDSIGEVALMSKGANFADPTAPMAADVGDSWNQTVGWSVRYAGLDPFRTRYSDETSGAAYHAPVSAGPTAAPGLKPYRTDGIPRAVAAAGDLNYHSLNGRTATDPHILQISSDDRWTSPTSLPNVVEPALFRHDLTSGDALEQNSLLKGISNIVTTRSDVFTVHLRVRTIRRNPATGRWDATDRDLIVDESRYVMGVDRSKVDRPGEKPEILYFSKVPN